MAKKTFTEKYDELDEHKKKVLMKYTVTLNDTINFKPGTFSMKKFAALCEDVLSKLWETQDSAEEINIELYMLLEIFFKSGIFIGKCRSDMVEIKDDNLKQLEEMKNLFVVANALSVGRQN